MNQSRLPATNVFRISLKQILGSNWNENIDYDDDNSQKLSQISIMGKMASQSIVWSGSFLKKSQF